jgi:hypothetical protein
LVRLPNRDVSFEPPLSTSRFRGIPSLRRAGAGVTAHRTCYESALTTNPQVDSQAAGSHLIRHPDQCSPPGAIARAVLVSRPGTNPVTSWSRAKHSAGRWNPGEPEGVAPLILLTDERIRGAASVAREEIVPGDAMTLKSAGCRLPGMGLTAS